MQATVVGVNLTSPLDTSSLTESFVGFTGNATTATNEISNFSLYTNYTGSFSRTNTTTFQANGTFNTTNLTWQFEANSTYLWNLQVCDTVNNCQFSGSNRSLIIYTAGENYNNILFSLFIGIGLLLLLAGYWEKDVTYITLSGVVLSTFGFVIIRGGFTNLQFESNLFTRAFALSVLGLGLYLLSKSTLAYLDIGVGGRK